MTNDAYSLPNPHEDPPMLKAALQYAALGWPVFPLIPRDKKPLRGSHAFYDATTAPGQIRAWWKKTPRANIGIACGGHMVVLDVDGPEGEKSVAELPIPPTVQVKTYKGDHYYFKPFAALTSENGLLPNVDVKAELGYIVAPPSVHPDGGTYEWAPGRSPEEIEMAPVPQWLIEEFLLKKTRPAARQAPARIYEPKELPESVRRYGEAALRSEVENVSQAETGTRNGTLNKAAFSLGQLVGSGILDEDRVRDELYGAAVQCGLAEDDGEGSVLGTIRSGLEAGKKDPEVS